MSRGPWKDRGFGELAEKYGYVAGEISIETIMEKRAQIEEWERHYEDETIPPDLGDGGHHLRKHIREEKIELFKLEQYLMPYVYAKRREIESRVEVKGESLMDLLSGGESEGD